MRLQYSDEELFFSEADSLLESEDDESLEDDLQQLDDVEIAEDSSRLAFGGDGAARMSISYQVLRWPVFFVIIIFIAVDLTLYFLFASLVRIYESLRVNFFASASYGIYRKMKEANTYQQYAIAARQLDTRMGKDAWKRERGDSGNLFDENLVIKVTNRLAKYRAAIQAETSSSRKRELIGKIMRILRQGACKANVRSPSPLIQLPPTHPVWQRR